MVQYRTNINQIQHQYHTKRFSFLLSITIRTTANYSYSYLSLLVSLFLFLVKNVEILSVVTIQVDVVLPYLLKRRGDTYLLEIAIGQ